MKIYYMDPSLFYSFYPEYKPLGGEGEPGPHPQPGPGPGSSGGQPDDYCGANGSPCNGGADCCSKHCIISANGGHCGTGGGGGGGNQGGGGGKGDYTYEDWKDWWDEHTDANGGSFLTDYFEEKEKKQLAESYSKSPNNPDCWSGGKKNDGVYFCEDAPECWDEDESIPGAACDPRCYYGGEFVCQTYCPPGGECKAVYPDGTHFDPNDPNTWMDLWNTRECWDYYGGAGQKQGFHCAQPAAFRANCWSGEQIGVGNYRCSCLEHWCWLPSGNPHAVFDGTKYTCQYGNCMPWTAEAWDEYEAVQAQKAADAEALEQFINEMGENLAEGGDYDPGFHVYESQWQEKDPAANMIGLNLGKLAKKISQGVQKLIQLMDMWSTLESIPCSPPGASAADRLEYCKQTFGDDIVASCSGYYAEKFGIAIDPEELAAMKKWCQPFVEGALKACANFDCEP